MKVIGHRGAKGLAPENTVAALQAGLKHGVDELEFDVRVTEDQVAILYHDPYMLNANGTHHYIHKTTFKELKTLKTDLVTLEEVLLTIGHPVPLQVEVKPEVPVEPVVAIVRQFLEDGWRPEYFLFGSFSQKTLHELHQAMPEIQLVVIERWSAVRATYRARQLKTKRISLAQRWLWWGVVFMLIRSGYQLAAYPVNTPRQGKWWRHFGLYAVITDFPDRFTGLK